MLELKNIVKKYVAGDTSLTALKGISVSFRENEFVAILGQSGCGKTTLLNIIGGLDQYTDGDLIINGKSTKLYKDSDWDTYRNHSIGFVFQSYNLIPHQTVLSNVELALTLSGVSKQERRKRAIEALEKVGLESQINKLPNQMSGGQMQRVAIARALVNNPDILLADEPTGALDSQTSIQIMDILKSVAKEKLVIMVTHNPELAESYATRTVRLLDGEIIQDTNPFNPTKEDSISISNKEKTKSKNKNKSMSFFTALNLSLNNLMTKKGRTILTSFAGSIGIIGIALILSVSTGVTDYIDSVETSTMASYPISIVQNSIDSSALTSMYDNPNEDAVIVDGYVTSNDMMGSLLETMNNMVKINNVSGFKKKLDASKEFFNTYATDIVYGYSTMISPYLKTKDDSGNVTFNETYKSLNEVYSELSANSSSVSQEELMELYGLSSSSNQLFGTFIGDMDFVESQYDVVYGHLPKNNLEAVLCVDDNNQIADYVLYCLGLRNLEELREYNKAMEKYREDSVNNPLPKLPEGTRYTYEELCNLEFSVLLNSDYYTIDNLSGLIRKASNEELDMKLKNTTNVIKICGIVKPGAKALMSSSTRAVLFTDDTMNSFIQYVNTSDVVTLQQNNEERNMTTGLEFVDQYTISDLPAITTLLMSNYTLQLQFASYCNITSMDDFQNIDTKKIIEFANKYMIQDSEYVMRSLGYVNFDTPDSIRIYPKDFQAKEEITKFINDYNASVQEKDRITYTDVVGLLLSSVTVIVNAISYVLIAFVSISLVVSSIMIGIITYISVLERTKEIGILRAIGASKKDVSRVFNAETISIGFTAGIFGIGITLILLIPINAILHYLTGISYLSAKLPVIGAILLVLISIFLTFISGLLPSGVAAKKDPVIALRSE